jgi:AraC family transcriptional regulator, transcriptional activator of pobA
MNRSVRRQIPVFALYGERSAVCRDTDPLHIEDIQSRSAKYLWRIATHRHSGLCQCVYVVSGPVSAQIEESAAELTGPALFVIPAGAVHGFGFRPETRGFVLTMDLDRLLERVSAAHQAPIAAMFSLPRSIVADIEPSHTARLSQLFDSLLREFLQPESHIVPVSGWLACSILWIVASAQHAAPRGALCVPGDFEKLRRFRLLVETHHLEHWSVKRYARELALSESSLHRLCSSLAGGSPFDLIQQRLALESRRRLIYVAGSVSAIAAELGFKDPAYFCRFFRKHTGSSPSEFRRRQAGG